MDSAKPKSILVSFDGPKGVGKSTLIKAVFATLKSKVSIAMLSEKELDHNRSVVENLLKKYRFDSSEKTDREILLQLAKNRALITQTGFDNSDSSIILLDRWYPSDVVFRRHLSVSECLTANLEAGCRVPDLILAITCDPRISWDRANSRSRGLDSLVIGDFEEHEQSCCAFDSAARMYHWTLVDTEQPVTEIAKEVAALVLKTFQTLRH